MTAHSFRDPGTPPVVVFPVALVSVSRIEWPGEFRILQFTMADAWVSRAMPRPRPGVIPEQSMSMPAIGMSLDGTGLVTPTAAVYAASVTTAVIVVAAGTLIVAGATFPASRTDPIGAKARGPYSAPPDARITGVFTQNVPGPRMMLAPRLARLFRFAASLTPVVSPVGCRTTAADPSHAAVATWLMVNPGACVTGGGPSSPRTTVHVAPDTCLTRIFSDADAGPA